MERVGRFVAVSVLALVALPGRAIDLGVSIGFAQPGAYGRIDIGQYPQPTAMSRQPVFGARAAPAAQPMYLRVPPGHQKDWPKHCARYNACNAPVYFVDEGWYQRTVMSPGPREADSRDQGEHHGKGHGHGHGKGHDH